MLRPTLPVLLLSCLFIPLTARGQVLGNLLPDLFLSEQSKRCIEEVKKDLSIKPGWLKSLEIEEAHPRNVARGKLDGQSRVLVTGLLDVTGTFGVQDEVVECYLQESAVRLGQKPPNSVTGQCTTLLKRVQTETRYYNEELGFTLGDGRTSRAVVRFGCQFPDEKTSRIEKLEPLRRETGK